MRHLILFLVMLTGLATACAGNAVSSRSGRGDLQVELWASRNCVQPGEAVKLRASVTNHGQKVQVIELKDEPVLDIQLAFRTTSQDYAVIRWSDGKTLTPDLTRLVLEPGQSKSIEMDWIARRPYGDSAGVAAFFRYDDTPSSIVRAQVTVFVATCHVLGP